jgi:hypothetical protein
MQTTAARLKDALAEENRGAAGRAIAGVCEEARYLAFRHMHGP